MNKYRWALVAAVAAVVFMDVQDAGASDRKINKSEIEYKEIKKVEIDTA